MWKIPPEAPHIKVMETKHDNMMITVTKNGTEKVKKWIKFTYCNKHTRILNNILKMQI